MRRRKAIFCGGDALMFEHLLAWLDNLRRLYQEYDENDY